MLRTLFKQWSHRRQPQIDGRIYLPALHAPVTIHRDQWGIPHIYTADRHDAWLAQGFVHAQERLWQMELNRRAANGTLSAVFGRLTLNTDRLARTLGFARLARHLWASLDPAVRADVVAYTAGVNAWLHNHPPLPIEFTLLHHKPQSWQPLDTLAYGRLQMWALTTGAMGEPVQARLVEALGAEKAADLGLRYPADNPATVPQGIETGGVWQGGLLGAWAHPFLGKGTQDGAGRGSNGWVIAPERSTTGRAILCNDMHLPVGTPSLWYAMHLHSDDGLHVAGFTQPGLPYILVGHNAAIAWGATLSYIDCEDLYIERFHPRHPTYYEFKGHWQQAEMYEELIQVRRRPPHVEKVIVTHHGPLINGVLAEHAQPLALNSMALRPETGMAGFRQLMEAHHWDDFVTAVSHIQSPSLNLLYADTQNNIGYYVCGHAPIRAKGDGTVPVPGWSGDYEWVGHIPFAQMPHALNPKQGFIVSANHRITGDAYPYDLGRMWRNGYRARRIEQLITGQAQVSLADCRRFHTDVYHIPGQELVHLLHKAFPETSDSEANFLSEGDAALALAYLRCWDGRLDIHSIGGTVYEVFIRQLSQAILSPHVSPDLLLKLLGLGQNPLMHPVNEFHGQWLVSLLQLLGGSSEKWQLDRRSLLETCLAQTTAELRHTLGNNPARWQWGRLHQITLAHAFGDTPVLGRIFNQGPYPIAGDENTVAQTSIRPDLPYNNNAISISSRLIVDLGDMGNTWGIHPPGQSGQLGSPHYGDLIQPWLEGEYYQIAWTEPQVTAVTHHTLTLHPPLVP